MISVPFLDLRQAYLELQDDIEPAVQASLASARYILGPEVGNFEAQFATYTGAEHCIGVANGLDALHLALRAIGIGPGDEVLVPSNTFIATWLAVSLVGATPVPVEPDPDTHNITVEGVAATISSKTRAIIPVHLYGCPAPIDDILQVARTRNIPVIEDAAQAQGAAWNGRRIGGHADAVTWSFYPGKNLGAMGDAGAITTNNPDLAQKIRLLGNYGSEKKYIHDLVGFNSRLDPVQAAILQIKLTKLDAWNARRKAVAARYSSALASSGLTLPYPPSKADPVWHLYVVSTPKRDALQKWLRDRGIETLIHYPCPPHRQQAYGTGHHLPIADRLSAEVLSLPIGPHLSDEQVGLVIEAVLAFSGSV